MTDQYQRDQKAEFAAQFGLSKPQYAKLSSHLHTEDLITCLELLKVKKFKSPFRKWANDQLRAWVDLDCTDSFPLTKTQLLRLAPHDRPVKLVIPQFI